MVAGDGDDVAGDACDEWRAIPGLEPGRGRNGLLGVFRSAGVFSHQVSLSVILSH
jgi:hypothetical protein